jgi:hypothetical protein
VAVVTAKNRFIYLHKSVLFFKRGWGCKKWRICNIGDRNIRKMSILVTVVVVWVVVGTAVVVVWVVGVVRTIPVVVRFSCIVDMLTG